MIKFATLARTLAFAAIAAASAAVHAAWPDKPIRLVHPYAGGGTGDMLTRELAAGLQQEFGVGVITDNRPGAGTLVGADYVAKSPADGYTVLMIGPGTHVIAPAIHPKMPYDADKDFELIGLWAVVRNMISVNPQLPVRNVKELVEYAKKNPGKLNYSSAGAGSGPHLAGEMFKQMTGTNMTHVAYKGAAPAILALLAGEVHVSFVNLPPQLPHVKAGKIRPLVVASNERSPLLPDVPDAPEAGLTGFVAESWYGLAVPVGTPAEVRAKLQAAMFKVGEDPQRKTRMASQGADIQLLDPKGMADYIKAERQRLLPIIKALDLKAE